MNKAVSPPPALLFSPRGVDGNIHTNRLGFLADFFKVSRVLSLYAVCTLQGTVRSASKPTSKLQGAISAGSPRASSSETVRCVRPDVLWRRGSRDARRERSKKRPHPAHTAHTYSHAAPPPASVASAQTDVHKAAVGYGTRCSAATRSTRQDDVDELSRVKSRTPRVRYSVVDP